MSEERQTHEEHVEGGAVAENAADGPLDDSEAAQIVGGSGGDDIVTQNPSTVASNDAAANRAGPPLNFPPPD